MNILSKINYFIIETLTTLHFKSKIDKNYKIMLKINTYSRLELKEVVIFVKNKKVCNEYIKIHKTRFYIDVKNSFIKNDIAMNLFILDKYNKQIRKSKIYE